jgi:pimeloyl-ACP methyl ester carboxylesterase
MVRNRALNVERSKLLAPGDGWVSRYPASESTVALAYEASGERGKPVLLLVHGGTASRRAWDLVTPMLRTSCRIVAVDLRGHGQSPAPDHGYSALQLSADINRLVDELDLGQVTVVGHSLGGMAAIFLAAHRPDVVNKLVLLNVPVRPNSIEALARLEARLRGPGFFPVTQTFVDEWSSLPQAVPVAFLATKQAHIRALRPIVWQQMFAELVQADITSTLRDIQQPTLILWGAKDGLLDAAQCEQLQAGIENARLVMMAEAGHTPSSATPDRVAEEIAAFAE